MGARWPVRMPWGAADARHHGERHPPLPPPKGEGRRQGWGRACGCVGGAHKGGSPDVQWKHAWGGGRFMGDPGALPSLSTPPPPPPPKIRWGAAGPLARSARESGGGGGRGEGAAARGRDGVGGRPLRRPRGKRATGRTTTLAAARRFHGRSRVVATHPHHFWGEWGGRRGKCPSSSSRAKGPAGQGRRGGGGGQEERRRKRRSAREVRTQSGGAKRGSGENEVNEVNELRAHGAFFSGQPSNRPRDPLHFFFRPSTPLLAHWG